MIVDSTAYWLSMISVYAAMIFLIILFPMLMWRSYLRGKPIGEKVMFSILTQTCFLVNVVIMLGLLKICNRYTLVLALAAEYCLVRWTFSDRSFFTVVRGFAQSCAMLLQGHMTGFEARRAFVTWISSNRRILRNPGRKFDIRKVFPVVFVLAVLLYNAWFIPHQVRVYHSYQFSDLPVHTSWVYGLEQGQIFSAGIYPFAMHAMIYVVGTLFGIETREVILYFGSFQTLLTVFTIYMFAKEIFRWKFSAYFVLILWSILMNQGRYAASLPQECGIFSFYAIGYYLVKMLHADTKKHIVPMDSKIRGVFRINQYLSRQYLNLDFFLLTISVSLAIAFHFYTAIAAIVFAVSIVVANIVTFLKKQYFVPIVAAAVVGAMIAIVPFGIAFASGIPFQESLEWAMSVINGEEWEGTGAGYLESITGESEENTESSSADSDSNEKASVFSRGLSLGELVRTIANSVSAFTSSSLFGTQLNQIVLFAVLITAVLSVPLVIIKPLRQYPTNYLALVITACFLCFMGASFDLGVTVILDANRSSVFLQPFYFLMIAMAMDAVFAIPSLLNLRFLRPVLAALSVVICLAVGYYMVASGHYHNFFDVNLAYYNEPDYLISQIRKSEKKDSFTVVSPTDEYYAVVQHGFHYELSELVADVGESDKEIKIPTDSIYFFIEKYTLQDYFYDRDFVNEEYAKMDFAYRASTQDYFYQRNIIESKAYYWAKHFAELYPTQMHVYFEDDIYIAYVLVQDPNSPLDLNVDYLSSLGV